MLALSSRNQTPQTPTPPPRATCAAARARAHEDVDGKVGDDGHPGNGGTFAQLNPGGWGLGFGVWGLGVGGWGLGFGVWGAGFGDDQVSSSVIEWW